jgi:hypothetical protein
MALTQRITNAFYRDGPIGFVKNIPGYAIRELGSFYRRTIWPKLPKTKEYGFQNGVKVPAYPQRIFDKIIPWHTKSYIPDFKSTNIDKVRENVKESDTVLSIGGGNGVTNVIEANQVGEGGEVIIFEASATRVKNLKATLEANGVVNQCDVRHAIVGEGQFISGELGDPNNIAAEDLPPCNVLEMDCEGSELSILEQLDQYPETVIVETHELKEYSPYDDVIEIINLLEGYGYQTERHQGPWVNNLVVGQFGGVN